MLTHAFLGAPRTATTSIWKVFNNHDEVACSIRKEPFNFSPKRVIFPEFYFKEFERTDKTKILLDATPAAYHYFFDKIKTLRLPVKIIYPMRNPYDRIYSTIKQMILTHALKPYLYKNHPFMRGKFDIDVDMLKYFIPTLLDYENISRAFKITEHVFIFKFEDMRVWDICEFLGVTPIDVELPKLNTMEKSWEAEHSKECKAKVDDFFYDNKWLDSMIQNDKERVFENFNYSWD